MQLSSASTPPPLRSSRSVFITLLGGCVILVSALTSVISFLTVLMMMAGSYGTSAGLTIEALCIIAGPPFTLVAGIALLFHKPWARLYLMALLFAVIAFNGYRIISGSSPSSTHSSADGVVNTRFGSPAQYSVPIIAVCIGLLLLLFSRGIRSEFGISTRTGLAALGGSKKWRVGHHGRDTMYYEEEIGGEWQRIDISG